MILSLPKPPRSNLLAGIRNRYPRVNVRALKIPSMAIWFTAASSLTARYRLRKEKRTDVNFVSNETAVLFFAQLVNGVLGEPTTSNLLTWLR